MKKVIDAKTAMIANEAGIAEGTILNYFNSKADILVAIISEYFVTENYKFSYNLVNKDEIKLEVHNAIKEEQLILLKIFKK